MAYKLEVYEYGIFVVTDDGVRQYQDIALHDVPRDDKGNYYYLFDDGEHAYLLCGKMSTKVNPLDFTIDEENVFHTYNGDDYIISKSNCEELINQGVSVIDNLYIINVLKVIEVGEETSSHEIPYTWSIEISSVWPDPLNAGSQKLVVYTGTLTGLTGGE